MTASASTETAVEAMKLGAYDYVTKPFKLDELRLTIANALERKRLQEENRELKRQLRREHGFDGFIGKSPRIMEVFETIRKTADSGSTVMITGESGTGKELVARAVHQESARRNGPFVSVNCAGVASFGEFATSSEGILRRVMEVNFFAPAELIRLAHPHLLRGLLRHCW